MDDALVEEFAITGTSPESVLPANWNIAPSKDIYLVRANKETNNRDLAIATWGMIGHWQKDLIAARSSQSHAINARCESVFEKPTFRDSFRTRRCLIPADGYYEWATALGPNRPKQPFYISRTDKSSLPMAGIWSEWRSPLGEVIQSAAIITHEAIGFLADIHSRMPVLMPRDRWDVWLDPSTTDIEHLRSLMEYSETLSGLTAYPVSVAVNSVRNNGAELTLPIALGEPETLF